MPYRLFVSASLISLLLSLWATDEVFSKGCSAHPALCCPGHNDSCFRSCFCDEYCLIVKDCCWDYTTTCFSGKTTGTPHTRTWIPSSQSNRTTEAIPRTEIIDNTRKQTSVELYTRAQSGTAVTMTPSGTAVTMTPSGTAVTMTPSHTATMPSVDTENLSATTGSIGETTEPPSMAPVLTTQSTTTTEAIHSTDILLSASPRTSLQPTTRSAENMTPNHTMTLLPVEATSINLATGLMDATTAAVRSTFFTWSTSIEMKTTEESTSDSVIPFGKNTTRIQTKQQFTATPRTVTEFSSALEQSPTLNTQTTNVILSSQSEEATLIKTTINVLKMKNLTVCNFTTTSVCLMWEKTDANESLYLILILEEPSFNRIVTTTFDTVGGLVPGKYYTFVVCVIVGNVKGKKRSISTYTRPEMVTNLRASNINMNSLTLTWDAPVGNRSFYIVNIIGDIVLTKSTVYESISFGNLTAGSTYLIKVSALAGDNAIQGNTKEISVRTYQSSLFISIRFSSLLSKPESEQLLRLQINKFLESTFPKQNITAIWKVER